MTDHLTRRHFLAALAASVVAVGAALPIGFPKEVVVPNWKRVLVTMRFADEASEAKARKEAPWIFVHTGDSNWKVEARQSS